MIQHVMTAIWRSNIYFYIIVSQLYYIKTINYVIGATLFPKCSIYLRRDHLDGGL